jgi:hypothetical protein
VNTRKGSQTVSKRSTISSSQNSAVPTTLAADRGRPGGVAVVDETVVADVDQVDPQLLTGRDARLLDGDGELLVWFGALAIGVASKSSTRPGWGGVPQGSEVIAGR